MLCGVHESKNCSDKLIVVFVNLFYMMTLLSAAAAVANAQQAPHDPWLFTDVTAP